METRLTLRSPHRVHCVSARRGPHLWLAGQEADEHEPLRDGTATGRLPEQADESWQDARMDSKREGRRRGQRDEKDGT